MKTLPIIVAILLSISLPCVARFHININRAINRATGGKVDTEKFFDRATGGTFAPKKGISPAIQSQDKANAEEAAKKIAQDEESKKGDKATAEKVGTAKALSAYGYLADEREKKEPKAVTPISSEEMVNYSGTMFQPVINLAPKEAKLFLNGQPYDTAVGVFFEPSDAHEYLFKAVYGKVEQSKPYMPKRDRAKVIEFNLQPPAPTPPAKE